MIWRPDISQITNDLMIRGMELPCPPQGSPTIGGAGADRCARVDQIFAEIKITRADSFMKGFPTTRTHRYDGGGSSELLTIRCDLFLREDRRHARDRSSRVETRSPRDLWQPQRSEEDLARDDGEWRWMLDGKLQRQEPRESGGGRRWRGMDLDANEERKMTWDEPF
jgi:hypothetical protein